MDADYEQKFNSVSMDNRVLRLQVQKLTNQVELYEKIIEKLLEE